jgi:hypothetical protein
VTQYPVLGGAGDRRGALAVWAARGVASRHLIQKIELPMLRANALGIAAVLSLVAPGSGMADDTVSRPRPTTPARMSCREFTAKFDAKNPTGLTRSDFSAGGLKFGEKAAFTLGQSGNQYCAVADASTWAVTKNVTSFYFVWAVTDQEWWCEAEAHHSNQAVKAYEQEHIDDVAAIAKTQTQKLRDRLKAGVCAPEPQKVEEAINKILDDALKDAAKQWDDAGWKRDGMSGHTHVVNCSCAR